MTATRQHPYSLPTDDLNQQKQPNIKHKQTTINTIDAKQLTTKLLLMNRF